MKHVRVHAGLGAGRLRWAKGARGAAAVSPSVDTKKKPTATPNVRFTKWDTRTVAPGWLESSLAPGGELGDAGERVAIPNQPHPLNRHRSLQQGS